jgi:hypothetical protein
MTAQVHDLTTRLASPSDRKVSNDLTPSGPPDGRHRVGYGHCDQPCGKCGAEHRVPVYFGLHLPTGERLCHDCANDALPLYGDIYEALDQLDGVLGEADDMRRLLLMLEIRRGVEYLHDRWLPDEEGDE